MTSLRTLTVCTTRADLAQARAAMNGRVGVVMTMGALHEGHGDLSGPTSDIKSIRRIPRRQFIDQG